VIHRLNAPDRTETFRVISPVVDRSLMLAAQGMLAEHAGQGTKNSTADTASLWWRKRESRSSLAASQTSLKLIEQDFISSPGKTVLDIFILSRYFSY
jgi:hypothetical protein